MSKCPDPDCKASIMKTIVGKYTFWTVVTIFVLIFGGALGYITNDFAKAADKNTKRIEENQKIIASNSQNAAVVAEQIRQLKDQLKKDNEYQRKRDILILEKLEKLLNGD